MKNYLEKSMTFAEYIKLIDDLLLDGKTTGPNQSEAMFNYGKLNRQRMHRLEKTVEIKEALKEKARNNPRKMIWLIITEGWCGDAAQNIPTIEKIQVENFLSRAKSSGRSTTFRKRSCRKSCARS